MQVNTAEAAVAYLKRFIYPLEERNKKMAFYEAVLNRAAKGERFMTAEVSNLPILTSATLITNLKVTT